MSKRIRQFCSIFLVLAIVIQLLPASVFAKDSAEDHLTPAATAPVAEQADCVEVLGEDLSKRDEFYKEFILDNGLRLATVYPTAVHYEKEGQWADIDNTLTVKAVRGQAVYTNTAGPWEVQFPWQLSGSNAISLTKDGYTVSFAMAGELRAGGSLSASATDTASLQTVTLSNTSTAQIQPIDTAALKATAEFEETVLYKLYARVQYDAIYANTNAVYDLDGSQLKESIVIRSYDAALRGYRYELNTGGLTPVLKEDRSIELCDPVTGTAVMTMAAPFMLDAQDEYCDDVQVALIPKGDIYLLVYQLPAQWLAEPERAWPVILDPVVSANNDRTNIQDITVAETGTESNNATTIKCGYHLTKGILRTYLRFKELPRLTSSDVIVKAEISLIKPYDSDLAAAIEVHKVTAPWQASEINWSNKPGINNTIEDITVVQDPAAYKWNITEIARSWYADTANTLLNNTGMMFKATNAIETGGTKNWQQFCSSDFGSDRPMLTIVYRATAGLESYWDTSSSSAGRAGTGYIQNYSGNLVWLHSDMGFGGNRMPVSINHVYNAGHAWETDTNTSANPFGLGNGWRTNYHQRIIALSGSDYVWEDGDGTRHEFQMTSSDVFLDKDGLNLTLRKSANGYTLTDKYGNTSTFDSQGRLIRQTDNQEVPSSIVITYEDSKLTEISDGVGRKYSFTYANGLLDKITYYGTGDTAVYEVTYNYVGAELTDIFYKDGKVACFDYTDKSLLSSVTDIDGYALHYTYNTLEDGKPSRVASVTEYSAGTAGGTTTLTYAYNCTTLTDHNNNTQTHFFNIWGNTVSIQNSEGQGTFAIYATDENEYGDAHRLRESSQQQVTVTNLIKDSSFESGSPWASASSSVASSIATNLVHLGQKSMKSESSSAGVTGPTCTEYTAQPNETYTFSAYVKVGSGTVKLRASVGSVTADSRTLMVDPEWIQLEVTVTNPDSVARPLTLSVVHEAPGTAYIDCVQLENTHGASRYNLIQNSDFQYSGLGWSFTGGTYPTGRDEKAPKLNNAMICMSGNTAEVRSITQTLPLSGDEGDMYVFAGWAKGESLAIKGNRTFRLVLTFHNTDGTTTAVPVSFNENLPSDQWQYAARGAVATKAYSSITLRAEYAYQAGTAYFDGIQLYKEGFGTRYAYDANGNVTAARDILGQITTYEYDYKNDMTKVTYPTKVEEINEYDAWHNLTKSTQRVWVENQEETEEGTWEQTTVTTYEYDSWGNLTKTTVSYELTGETPQSLTMTTESFYTADGNYLYVAKDELGNGTTYEYDLQTGVLLSVKQPEDTPTSKTVYTYDKMYRLEKVSEGTGENAMTASYTYKFDQLSSISKLGTSYAMSYNAHNDLSSISVGTSVLAAYSYTNDRNRYLSSLAYGNGDVVEYTYDDLGRVTKEEYFENESETASRTVTYTYNETGNLSKMTDSKTGMTTTYSYDPLGRLVSSYETDGTSKKSSAYSYYATGDLKAESYLINSTRYKTIYEYDGLRRVTKVQNSDLTTGYLYDAFSRLIQTATYVGDDAVIWETITYGETIAGVTINRIGEYEIRTNREKLPFMYNYDGNGNITEETRSVYLWSDNVNDFILDDCYTTAFKYDGSGRLLQESNELAGKIWVWTYDNAGNITSRTEHDYSIAGPGDSGDKISYTYTDSSWGDLLTSYNGNTITYDAIGNPLTDGTWTYTWEQGRQLAKMQSSTATWTYSYGTDGLRRSRSNGTTTYHYWYNDSGLLLRLEKGSAVYSFTYDPAGRPATITQGNTTYFYALNQQGDVVGIVDGNGVFVVQYLYDAWGRLLSISGNAKGTLGTNNPLRYRGYVYDTETGLYYLQSRYYNPEMGRFINADNNFSYLNLFAYCANNPVNATDPNGEHWYFLWIDDLFEAVDELMASVSNITFGREASKRALYDPKGAQELYNSRPFQDVKPSKEMQAFTEFMYDTNFVFDLSISISTPLKNTYIKVGASKVTSPNKNLNASYVHLGGGKATASVFPVSITYSAGFVRGVNQKKDYAKHFLDSGAGAIFGVDYCFWPNGASAYCFTIGTSYGGYVGYDYYWCIN